jgi:hypothetical protein
MSNSLTVSAYVFLVVFTFLGAIVFAARALGRSGTDPAGRGRLKNRKIIARQHLALLRSRRDSAARARSAPEEHLAPPPIPQDHFAYMQASDYLLNLRSPYPISPPQPRQLDER